MTAYEVTTQRQSYFQLDSDGKLERQNDLPVRREKAYRFERTISPRETAIVVMDPWADMASTHLNEYFGEIAESRILPFVNKALERGHPVLVLTNDPETVKYNTKIHPELTTLAANDKINVLFHQDFDGKKFADCLSSQGVDSLIYIGFASNMCILGRRTGMIPMRLHGFKLFIVPEASAAIETRDSWGDQSLHRATTKIISQWIAEILHYDDFMEATAAN